MDEQPHMMVDLATSATFVHAEYLCLLQHSVLAPLRQETTDWQAVRFGVAVVHRITLQRGHAAVRRKNVAS